MTEPPKPKEGDEIGPMCRRPKSKHSPEELLTCSRKMEEFKKNTKGGAGIEWIFANISGIAMIIAFMASFSLFYKDRFKSKKWITNC